MKFSLFFIFLLLSLQSYAQPSSKAINRVVNELNHLRSKGCKCGNEYMYPVQPLQWNHLLYEVSREYARYLYSNNLFSHISKDGKTLGDRLDARGYDWMRIGENLGKGYNDFFDVLKAWIESPTHCKMLMDPDVTDFGMSKHQDYWVQSFSKPMQTSSY